MASVSVGVGACQRIPLSVLAQNPHKWTVRKISHETGGRRGKEVLREDRRTQWAEGSRRDQSTEQISQEIRVGQRGDQSTEIRKAAARTYWPKNTGLTNARRCRHSSWLCGSFAQIHTQDSRQMHGELLKSVTDFPPLALGANPSPIICPSFLLPPRLCILCVGKEMWNTPGQRWEKH